MSRPNERLTAGVPSRQLPIVLQKDRRIETNARLLGRGTGWRGQLEIQTYELERGELEVTTESRLLRFVAFVLGLLGPALFGFGFGIFSAGWRAKTNRQEH